MNMLLQMSVWRDCGIPWECVLHFVEQLKTEKDKIIGTKMMKDTKMKIMLKIIIDGRNNFI